MNRFILSRIVRTLWRKLISHKRLLEWKPSNIVERQLEENHSSDLAAVYQTMWIAPAIAVLTWTVMPAMNASALRIAAPILLLWLVSPALAWWVSRPLPAQRRSVARSSKVSAPAGAQDVGIFETYVNAEENWLPPDNVQQKSVSSSHSPSPTNMGLALLSITAYIWGIKQAGSSSRARRMRCARCSRGAPSGHLFNWYDTRALAPLTPRLHFDRRQRQFVGSLLTLRVGLCCACRCSDVHARWLEGIQQTHSRSCANRSARMLRAWSFASLPRLSARAERNGALQSVWPRRSARH